MAPDEVPLAGAVPAAITVAAGTLLGVQAGPANEATQLLALIRT